MPIYEFKCPQCGREVEWLALKAMNLLCKECGAPMVKLMSVPSIVYEFMEARKGA